MEENGQFDDSSSSEYETSSSGDSDSGSDSDDDSDSSDSGSTSPEAEVRLRPHELNKNRVKDDWAAVEAQKAEKKRKQLEEEEAQRQKEQDEQWRKERRRGVKKILKSIPLFNMKKRSASAIVIQRIVRGCLVRTRVRTERERRKREMRKAIRMGNYAMKLQRNYRRRLAKRRVEQLKIEHAMAIRLQAIVRMRQSRVTLRIKAINRDWEVSAYRAVRLIQRIFRGRRDRKLAHEFATRVKAARILQNACRPFLERREAARREARRAQEEMYAQLEAWRDDLIPVFTVIELRMRMDAAKVITKFLRPVAKVAVKERVEETRGPSALVIQRIYRGHMGRARARIMAERHRLHIERLEGCLMIRRVVAKGGCRTIGSEAQYGYCTKCDCGKFYARGEATIQGASPTSLATSTRHICECGHHITNHVMGMYRIKGKPDVYEMGKEKKASLKSSFHAQVGKINQMEVEKQREDEIARRVIKGSGASAHEAATIAIETTMGLLSPDDSMFRKRARKKRIDKCAERLEAFKKEETKESVEKAWMQHEARVEKKAAIVSKRKKKAKMKRFKELKAKESRRAFLARRRRENREMAEMHASVASERRRKREAAMREREMEVERDRIRKRDEARARRRARARERMLARQRERHSLPSPLPSQYASESEGSDESVLAEATPAPYIMDGVVMSPSVSPGSMVGSLELSVPGPSSPMATLSLASTPFSPATQRVFRKHAMSPPEEHSTQSIGVQTLPTVVKQKAKYMPYSTQLAIEKMHNHVEQVGMFYHGSDDTPKPQLQMPSLSPPKKRRESYAAPSTDSGGGKEEVAVVELSAKPSSPEDGASRDPYLELVEGDDETGSAMPKRIPLDKSPLFLGRARQNDVTLDSQRHPRMVSKVHLVIHTTVKEKDGHVVEIVDLKSTNGTFLNGAERVSSEAGRRTRLQNGDLITLGSTGSEVPQSRSSSRRSRRRKPRTSDVVYCLVIRGASSATDVGRSGNMMRLFERRVGTKGKKKHSGGIKDA